MSYNRYDDSSVVRFVIFFIGFLSFVAGFFCLLNFFLAGRYSQEHSLIAMNYGHAWLITCICTVALASLWHDFASKILLRLRTERIIQVELVGHSVGYDFEDGKSIKRRVEFEWQDQKFTLPVTTEDSGFIERNERVTSLLELRLDKNGRLLGAKVLD